MNHLSSTNSENLQKEIEPELKRLLREAGVLYFDTDDLVTVMNGNKREQYPALRFQYQGCTCEVIFKAQKV